MSIFISLGMRLGVNRIAKYASAVGLGSPTGFPLGREKPGLVPTSSWKMKRFGVPWQAGENLSMAIGQGYNLVTPAADRLHPLGPVQRGEVLSAPDCPDHPRPPWGDPQRVSAPGFAGIFQSRRKPWSWSARPCGGWSILPAAPAEEPGGRLQCGRQDGHVPGRTEEGRTGANPPLRSSRTMPGLSALLPA